MKITKFSLITLFDNDWGKLADGEKSRGKKLVRKKAGGEKSRYSKSTIKSKTFLYIIISIHSRPVNIVISQAKEGRVNRNGA